MNNELEQVRSFGWPYDYEAEASGTGCDVIVTTPAFA
jgi:hypothetical protein